MKSKNLRIAVCILLLLLGLLGLVCFLIPLVHFGIINTGNIAGIFLSLCLILYGLLMRSIHRLIRNIWKKRIGKWALCFIGACAVAGCAVTLFVSIDMIRFASQELPHNATVIVLGCKVNDGQPSPLLKMRLDAAYTYLSENEDSACIVSGGQGDDEVISEAECMYRYLIECGIDPNRIYCEDESTTTKENLTFSKEIIVENNLNPKIVIVTNNFHEYRANKLAHSLELDTSAVPAETAWYFLPTYYVREIFCIVYEWMFRPNHMVPPAKVLSANIST